MKFFYKTKDARPQEIDCSEEKKDQPSIVEVKGRAVVKLSFDDKFMITKAGALEWLCREINRTYGKYTRGVASGTVQDSLYFPLVKHCYKYSIDKVFIEIVFQSENGYEVLKNELEQLTEAFKDKNCLNTNNIPYIPKTTHAKKGSSWLKQNEYLNFMKLLKKYEY